METIQPCGKEGISIPRPVYNAIATLIIEQLKLQETASLPSLLQAARDKISLKAKDHWLVYYVKLDLESRGYIVADTSHQTGQLRLTGKGYATDKFY
jgi:hypothetical protein